MLNSINRVNPLIRAVGGTVIALSIIFALAFQSPVAAQSKDVEAVRNVLMQDAAAIEKGDLATLDKLWANDDSVIVIENGHANYGWADYRNNHLAPELKEMKNIRYSLSDIKIKVSGATAWATFRTTISADFKERHIESSGLGTAVLERRDGRWQFVHWHSSSPRRTPAASAAPAKKG